MKLRLQMIISRLLNDKTVPRTRLRSLLRSTSRKKERRLAYFFSASLLTELRQAPFSLLKELKDVFVWNYNEIPGLDPMLATRRLNIKEETKPVKNASRNFARGAD